LGQAKPKRRKRKKKGQTKLKKKFLFWKVLPWEFPAWWGLDRKNNNVKILAVCWKILEAAHTFLQYTMVTALLVVRLVKLRMIISRHSFRKALKRETCQTLNHKKMSKTTCRKYLKTPRKNWKAVESITQVQEPAPYQYTFRIANAILQI